MQVDPLNIGALLVAAIAALGAWLAQRASAKAVITGSRSVAETEAYNRARKMDVETIQRQDAEYAELEQKYLALKERLKARGQIVDDD